KKLFASQSQLSPNRILDIASESGMGRQELQECMESSEIHRKIVSNIEEGRAIGVNATPSIFINGKKLEYGTAAQVLRAALIQYTKNLHNHVIEKESLIEEFKDLLLATCADILSDKDPSLIRDVLFALNENKAAEIFSHFQQDLQLQLTELLTA